MHLTEIPLVLSALFCLGLALLVFFRNPRSFVHQTFTFGMISLGLREMGSIIALLASSPDHFNGWLMVSLAGEALLPGTWLLFSLSFARSNYKELLFKWKGLILVFFGFPLFLVFFSWPHLFNMPPSEFEGAVNLIPLDRAGYFLKLFLLVSFVLILIQLEGTFRASSGIKRWQIKFMILGTGGILAFGIYDVGQALLYSAISLNLFPVRAMVIILADAVILFALIRHRLLDVDVFVSRYVLYNSVILLVSGLYLFLVGLTVFGIRRFGGTAYLPFIPVLVFGLLIGMAVFLLSEELRRKVKDFINTHFYKNKHDYRLKWQEFNLAVSTKLSMGELSSSVVSWLADTMGTSSAAIWVYDPDRRSFELAGQIGSPQPVSSWPSGSQFVQLLREKVSPVMNASIAPTTYPLPPPDTSTPEVITSYALSVPLFSGQEMSGLAMLGAKITRDPYDFHDLEFLKIAGNQIAGQIHRVRITEDLAKAKEMEAFQTVSTFFIHDLKNLSSMLSLVVQNLPANIDNPEFRKDAFRIISESVGKMNQISGKLSLVTKNLVLNRTESDLNQLVNSTLTTLRHSIQVPLSTNLQPLPNLSIDQKEIEKVLVNLILNANDAIKNNGEILITTGRLAGSACLSVKDNGSGMTPEYISKSLFLPFQTTKSKGLGIGLFQCKKIIEAHQGRIEVTSEPGKGSEFRVLLPMRQGTGDRGVKGRE